jgi:hypothetical protein
VDTSLDLSLDTPALRFINGPDDKVPKPPSALECALQLEAVAQSLKDHDALSYIIGNRAVEHERDLMDVLLKHPDFSGLTGRLLAGGRVRLVGEHTYRVERKPFDYTYRRLNVYLGYSHRIAFWAWTDYQQKIPHDEDTTLVGGALEAVHLEKLFTIWGDEPGRILNGLLKVVKSLSDGEAAAKRLIAENLDMHSATLHGMTAQLDRMLPAIEPDDSEFDWWPAP